MKAYRQQKWISSLHLIGQQIYLLGSSGGNRNGEMIHHLFYYSAFPLPWPIGAKQLQIVQA